MPQVWRWNADKERVLELVFEGRYSQPRIAEETGVALRTVTRWIARPEFQERLEELRADLARSLSSVAYLRKEQRLIALSQVAEQARQDFEARTTVQETRAGNLTSEQFNAAAFNAFRTALDDIARELGARRNPPDIIADTEEWRLPEVVTVTLTSAPPPEPVDPHEQGRQQQPPSPLPSAVVEAARAALPAPLVSLHTRPPTPPVEPDEPDDEDDEWGDDSKDDDMLTPALLGSAPRLRR